MLSIFNKYTNFYSYNSLVFYKIRYDLPNVFVGQYSPFFRKQFFRTTVNYINMIYMRYANCIDENRFYINKFVSSYERANNSGFYAKKNRFK